MRAVNLFLFFIFITFAVPSHSQDLGQYFLKPSDKEGNPLTQYFRTHTAILYDSNPCEDRVFYSHLTTPAHTLPGNRFAYEPFPGARFDGFLMNSLSMGLWKGIQIGTVPSLYMFNDDRVENGDKSEHTSNYNLKWTLFSFKNLDIGYAFSTMGQHQTYGTPINIGGKNYDEIDIGFFWSTLIINYYFEHLPIALGINFSSISLSSENGDLNREFKKQNTHSEKLFDINYLYNENWSFTIGGGKVKETAFELEDAYWGYGGTVTYVRNKKWFNQISVGLHHFNVLNSNKILFSFSI